jgi:hypothetical protein
MRSDKGYYVLKLIDLQLLAACDMLDAPTPLLGRYAPIVLHDQS